MECVKYCIIFQWNKSLTTEKLYRLLDTNRNYATHFKRFDSYSVRPFGWRFHSCFSYACELMFAILFVPYFQFEAVFFFSFLYALASNWIVFLAKQFTLSFPIRALTPIHCQYLFDANFIHLFVLAELFFSSLVHLTAGTFCFHYEIILLDIVLWRWSCYMWSLLTVQWQNPSNCCTESSNNNKIREW